MHDGRRCCCPLQVTDLTDMADVRRIIGEAGRKKARFTLQDWGSLNGMIERLNNDF